MQELRDYLRNGNWYLGVRELRQATVVMVVDWLLVVVVCGGGGICCSHVLAYFGVKLNSVVLVRGRTIQTERPPLVGEVSATFCG
jgi:hypothetical protein